MMVLVMVMGFMWIRLLWHLLFSCEGIGYAIRIPRPKWMAPDEDWLEEAGCVPVGYRKVS